MNEDKTIVVVLIILILVLVSGCLNQQNTNIKQTIPLVQTSTTRLPTTTYTTTPKPIINPTHTSVPTNTQEYSLGDQITDPIGQGIYLYVPMGEFEMGSHDGEPDESPLHTVYLDAFWIGQTEVTNAMFKRCVDAGVCDSSAGEHFEDAAHENYPVTYVNWFDAKSYCDWVGGRLPTEAEWEKAARGGSDGGIYPWGDEYPSCDQGANNGAQFNLCDGGIVPVGSFGSNGYGLYDMAGNVLEWVADWYDYNYYQETELDNPIGPEAGPGRALRGGSWGSVDFTLRSASRGSYFPEERDNSIGFRCVVPIQP